EIVPSSLQRPCRVRRRARFDLVRLRVAPNGEPLSAPVRMTPTFVVKPFGVLAHEQIIAPGLIGTGLWVDWADEVGRTTTGEFAGVARSAVRARDRHHSSGSVLSIPDDPPS